MPAFQRGPLAIRGALACFRPLFAAGLACLPAQRLTAFRYRLMASGTKISRMIAVQPSVATTGC